MKVIAHERGSWFLLQDNERYIFDVNINNSFVSYSFTCYLNQEEINSYLKLGNAFLNDLALKIERTINLTNSSFKNRLIEDKDLSDLILQTIVQWRKETDTKL